MSRSWERKVRKNMQQVNKQRKKTGAGNLVLDKPVKDDSITFKGQNFILPAMLVLFIGMYNVLLLMSPAYKIDSMFWLTNIAYLIMAALFYFRKPYLTIGKDYVKSRRMLGDKQLFAVAIKEIKIQGNYAIVVPKNGSSWAYSKAFNRYPIEDMKVELKKLAEKHNIAWSEV